MSFRCPCVYCFQRPVYLAFIRVRHLLRPPFINFNKPRSKPSLNYCPCRLHVESKYDNIFSQKVGVTESHRVYKANWMPTISEKLSVQSKDNIEYAIAVIKDDQIVSQIHFVIILSLLCLRFTFDGPYLATLPALNGKIWYRTPHPCICYRIQNK